MKKEENHAYLGMRPPPLPQKLHPQDRAVVEFFGKLRDGLEEYIHKFAEEHIKGTPIQDWHLSSPHVKAWLANGLDELRQAFHPGVQYIQPGQAPGLYGMPTTGEATHERMGELSLDDFRALAEQNVKKALEGMDGHTQGRGGMSM